MEYHLLFDVMKTSISIHYIIAIAIISAVPPIFVIGIGGTLYANIKGKPVNLRVLFTAVAVAWAVLCSLFIFKTWQGTDDMKKAFRTGDYKTVEGELVVEKKTKSTDFLVKSPDAPEGQRLDFGEAEAVTLLENGDRVRVAVKDGRVLRLESVRRVDITPSGDLAVLIVFLVLGIPFVIFPITVILRMAGAARAVLEPLPDEVGLTELRREAAGGWFAKLGSPGRPFQVSRPFVRLSLYRELLVIRCCFSGKKSEDIVLAPADVTGIEPSNGRELLGKVSGAVSGAVASAVGAKGVSIAHRRTECSNPVVLWPSNAKATLDALREWRAAAANPAGPAPRGSGKKAPAKKAKKG